MAFSESAVVFDCAGEQLLGVAAVPDAARSLGVLVIVGGRQYRAGSHRQFVLLSRRLASADFFTFRFDLRGMGDSSGQMRSFDTVDADIAAAMDAIQTRCPEVRRFMLWGLCDGASAAALYWERTRDRRVAAMCLANPWVRSETSLARTRVRHYYRQRIMQRGFWQKLLRGGVGTVRSIREYLASWRASRRSETIGFQQRMLDGLCVFPGPLLLLLGERDLTAREFLDRLEGGTLLRQSNVRKIEIAGADHTFSREAWRLASEEAVLDWLNLVAGQGDNAPETASADSEQGTERTMEKTRLLFVCMGNICRSPTAEGVVRSHLEKAGLADRVEIDSAGTHGYHVGKPPDARAQKTAASRGYDLARLRGRRVSEDDYARFDRILAMDLDNLAILKRECPPEHSHKLCLFLDYARSFTEREVPDPYYGGDAGFERVLDMIEDAAAGLIEDLRRAR